MDEKGVSETLGYMMILGVVLILISIVYVQVYSTTIDTAEKFRMISMRESFRKIYDVFALSLYGGANLQQIQLELQGGSFYILNNTTVEILVESEGVNDNYVFNLRSLNYEFGDFRISFENGALLEEYYNYSNFVQPPSIYIKPVQSLEASGSMERVIVLVLNEIESNVSVSGGGSIVMIFNSSLKSSKIYPATGNATLTITSDFPELWMNYFNELGGSVSRVGNNQINVHLTFNKLVLTVYTTNVTIKKF